MTSAAGGRRGAGRPGCKRHVRARGGGGGSGMRGAERRAGGARGRPGPSPSRALPSGSRRRGDESHPRLPRAPPELPLTWRGAGGGEPDTPLGPAATGMGPSCRAEATRPRRLPRGARRPRRTDSRRRMPRGWRPTGHACERGRAGEEETQAGQGLWRGGQESAEL